LEPAEQLGAKGLDSKLVVGEAVLGVAGVNELLFVGSNMQLNISPLGMAAIGGPPPRWLDALAGAGYGGNLLLTVGTNTLVTTGGHNIILKEGHDTEYPIENHPISRLLCRAIGLVTVIWAIVYAERKSLKDRFILWGVTQTLLTALLFVLMAYEGFRFTEMKASMTATWAALHRAFPWIEAHGNGGGADGGDDGGAQPFEQMGGGGIGNDDL
jgi:hypothetical protein